MASRDARETWPVGVSERAAQTEMAIEHHSERSVAKAAGEAERQSVCQRARLVRLTSTRRTICVYEIELYDWCAPAAQCP